MTKLEADIRHITSDPKHYPQTSRAKSESNAEWILGYASRMSTEWQNITAKMDDGDWFWIAETLVFWGLAEKDFRPAKAEKRQDWSTGETRLVEMGCRCYFRLKPESLETTTT